MPVPVRFLSPNDLHDIVRGMAVIARLYDPQDPDIRFHLDQETSAALGIWKDFDGNECHFLFSPEGSLVMGFDHASPMSPHVTMAETGDFQPWAGIYDTLPPALKTRLENDPPYDDAFDYKEVTFCLWNVGNTREWQKGDVQYPPRDNNDPDGQAYVLGRIKEFYEDFCGAFEEHYNWDLDPDHVADLLSGDRVSLTCIKGLKPDTNVLEARKWMSTMGFVIDAPTK